MARRGASSLDNPAFTGKEAVVVLHGPEAFLQSEAIRLLREAIETATGGACQTAHFEGTSAALADVLDELRSYGLMGGHKLVVVREAEEFVSRHREALERYAASPASSATLVLRPNTCPANTKLHKLAAKCGRVVKCEAPSPDGAVAWAVRRAKQHYTAALSRGAAALLVEHVGTGLGLLDAELSKLAAGVEKGGTISAERVEVLAGRASDEKAWEIQEALLSGDPECAVAKLRELLDLSGQPEVLVARFVGDLLRKLHHAAVMAEEGEGAWAICQALKVWPRERHQPFLAAAKALGRAGAARFLAQLVEVDRRSKSGLGNLRRGLEALCVDFCGELGANGGRPGAPAQPG